MILVCLVAFIAVLYTMNTQLLHCPVEMTRNQQCPLLLLMLYVFQSVRRTKLSGQDQEVSGGGGFWSINLTDLISHILPSTASTVCLPFSSNYDFCHRQIIFAVFPSSIFLWLVVHSTFISSSCHLLHTLRLVGVTMFSFWLQKPKMCFDKMQFLTILFFHSSAFSSYYMFMFICNM